MADPLDNETPKEFAAPPKNKSLFNKSTWNKPAEFEDGVGFFSRAKDLFPIRAAEEERKRQKKLAKLERKRSTASAEGKESSTPEVKRRRVSSQAEDREHSSDSSPDNNHNDEADWTSSRRLV